MRRSRLVSVTGPGGAGKTRLALRLGAHALDRHPDGVWLIELADLDDSRLLEQVVASACRIREGRRRPMLEVLADRLGSSRTLLILDGCERVVQPCAGMVDRLLRACPRLTVLVTSREPLGVAGELIWRIPSLTLPSLDGNHLPEKLLKSEAGLLFIARARLARPEFNLDRTVSGEVAEICTRLDGLPLAIELAASLVAGMTVHEIRGKLGDRFRLLTGGSRSALPRHRTLRQAVDWSYDLLGPDERALLAQLAVFAGGFDADSAQAVGRPEGAQAAIVLPILLRLVDKSLVTADGREPSRMRYRLLDSIRDYALDKLQEASPDDTRGRHASHFLQFCTMATEKLRLLDHTQWLARIDEEEPNIRVALTWCQGKAPEMLITFSRHMARYWIVRGKFQEGLEWLDHAVRAGGTQEERLGLLSTRAILRRHRGDHDGALHDLEECAALATRPGFAFQLMSVTANLGAMNGAVGNLSEAERYSREALKLAEELGDDRAIAGSLNNLALVESARGDHVAAKILVDRMLRGLSKVDDRISRGVFLESAGRIERRSGAYAVARQRYSEALAISSELEDMLNLADILDGLALLALSEGDPARTLVLAAASTRQREISQSERSPVSDKELRLGVTQAEELLGAHASRSASHRGSLMGWKEAFAYASGASNGAADHLESPLTPREMQVASLIAEGLTNSEIAVRLGISDRTADAHVEHIRNKLNLRTRALIAVWAHDTLNRA